jgi:hypothetical protein
MEDGSDRLREELECPKSNNTKKELMLNVMNAADTSRELLERALELVGPSPLQCMAALIAHNDLRLDFILQK